MVTLGLINHLISYRCNNLVASLRSISIPKSLNALINSSRSILPMNKTNSYKDQYGICISNV